MLELFYASGLRLSELVGLDVDDVNLSARMVRVLGKGRKERLVPFNRSAEAAIRAWLRDREVARRQERRGVGRDHDAGARGAAPGRARASGSGRTARSPLFVNYRGGRAHRPQRAPAAAPLRRRVQPALRRSARTRCATRSRRTCCSAAPTCATIQELLGHARLSTTQRYTHVNVAQLMEVYKKTPPAGVSDSPHRASRRRLGCQFSVPVARRAESATAGRSTDHAGSSAYAPLRHLVVVLVGDPVSVASAWRRPRGKSMPSVLIL